MQFLRFQLLPVRLRRLLRFGLLGVLAITLTLSCGRTPEATTGSDAIAPSAEIRIIDHALGRTAVPESPQRVVSLNWLDQVLALGIKPVGSTHNVEAYLQEQLQGIENIGGSETPNLEKVTLLKPDLILGRQEYHEKLYGRLNQIAPTVLEGFDGGGDWKAILQLYGEAVGKPEAAAQVLQDYDNRITQLREQLGNRLQTLKVSIVRIRPDGIALYLKSSFAGTILEEVGLSRPAAQDQEESAQGWNQITISKERLQDADGDVIFLWAFGDTVQARQSAQAKLAELKADPLWSQLQAVQQGKVYEVPDYWIGGGPIAANRVLDDLFKYLVPETTS